MGNNYLKKLSEKVFNGIADLINGSSEPKHVTGAKKKRSPKAPLGKTKARNISEGKDMSGKGATKKKVGNSPQKKVGNSVKSTTLRNQIPGENAIEKKGTLINAVISRLQANYRGEQHSMEDKVLSIYILDSIFFDSVQSSEFKTDLESAMSVELGFKFNRIEIKNALIPSKDEIVELYWDVYISVRSVQKAKTIRRAIIRPVENNGSTLDPEYYLDSEQIAMLPNCRYNIGVGRNPVMDDFSHRENHIAIDDDPHSSEYDKNKYVSRSHAYISFSDEYGFILNVELGGTRAARKRTHIHRGSEKIELDNILIPVPLRDGDYIILSKYVHLLFKEA